MIRIIVFGVSGVGKTTACRNFVARNPNFTHVTASKLISDATGATLEQLRHAGPDLIMFNQAALAKRLLGEIDKQHLENVIIDGQCVLDNGSELVIIPVEHIRPLHPTGFVLLEAKPEELLKRRLNDTRLRPQRTVEELVSQMEVNRLVVKDYSTSLHVPSLTTDASENFDLTPSISDLLRRAKNP